jgi:hypothetical protein
MPDAPQQRSDSGSAYQIGANASGSIGAGLNNATAPYISGLVITNSGRPMPPNCALATAASRAWACLASALASAST